MAKRKNSTALFEVIRSDVRFTTAPRRKWAFHLPKLPFSRKASAEPSRAASAISEAAPSIGAEPRRAWNLERMLPRLGMSLDADRQVVHFQLSFTTALVAVFALVLLVALSYVSGKHSSRQSVLAVADQTTDELRAGPAQAGVLDVTGEGLRTVMAAAPSAADGAQTTSSKASPAAAKASAPPAQADLKRQPHLQYVVIQSYPPAEKQYADEAAKLLNNNGIPCTVENDLAFAPHWFCVVGMTPFEQTRNSSEYDEYIARIERIGNHMSGTSKFVKKFEPHPIGWPESH